MILSAPGRYRCTALHHSVPIPRISFVAHSYGILACKSFTCHSSETNDLMSLSNHNVPRKRGGGGTDIPVQRRMHGPCLYSPPAPKPARPGGPAPACRQAGAVAMSTLADNGGLAAPKPAATGVGGALTTEMLTSLDRTVTSLQGGGPPSQLPCVPASLPLSRANT